MRYRFQGLAVIPASLLFVGWIVPTTGSPAQEKEVSATLQRRDGQHDFDFDIGTWKTHLRRLIHPLTGSTTWVEYEGTTVVRKVWNGRANLAELEADGPPGHLEVLSLRLYIPEAHRWALNITSSASGVLSPAAIGEFRNGRGDFVEQETINGNTIL